ncbi:hypothetical protein [Mesoterricola silvestris]|uniref:hypothetical protein n=1 Tax=Mesoterricola silvestris TaxID=2927979 RepID=UPI00292FE51A|nr:hypothetical protein [Mesoterricola silvestris]
MKIQELDQHLPNGIHDAELYSLNVDFKAKSIKMLINFWIGNLGGSNQEMYRMGELDVINFSVFSIDPPDQGYPFIPNGDPLTITSCQPSEGTLKGYNAILKRLPADSGGIGFFVEEWNSFIHIIGGDVYLKWN